MNTHKHHLVPRYMGGSDDPSNLVELTVYEHANIHKKLWETNGNKQDYLAWKGLSGELKDLELSAEMKSLGGSISMRNKMAKDPNHHKVIHAKMMENDPEHYVKVHNTIRETNPNHYKEAAKASHAPTETCEHCGKVLGKANYARHHGDRCKFKEG